MAKAKKNKKSKGFLAAAGSLLGSIPAVGSVKTAAKKVKQATKKTVQKVKKVTKIAKKTVKKTVNKKKKQLKANLKKAKKKVKKAKKKAKKKIGKVFTKARKLKNNLSPKQQIKKLKKNMKKAVLAGKKVKKKVKKVVKKVKATVADVKSKSKKLALKVKKAKDKIKWEDVTSAATSAVNLAVTHVVAVASFVADFIPIVSNVKSGYEAAYGKDPITRQELDNLEQGIAAASIFLGGIGKVVKWGKKGVEGALEVAETVEEIVSAIEKSKVPPLKVDKPTVNDKFKDKSPETKKKPDVDNTKPTDPVEGAGKSGTPPRYGDRQISDEEYDILRDRTPTQKLRDKINEGHDKKSVTQDEILPGKTFKGALEADHIVPMDRVTRMDGFGNLTEAQKLEVLNNQENFTGLSKSANTSKQSKSFEEWTHYKKGKPGEIEVNPDFREKMIVKEKELERNLQKQIDDFNELNSKNK